MDLRMSKIEIFAHDCAAVNGPGFKLIRCEQWKRIHMSYAMDVLMQQVVAVEVAMRRVVLLPCS